MDSSDSSMSDPSIVPDRLTAKINYKIICLIVAGMSAFFYVVNYTFFSEEDAYLIISIFIIIVPTVVGAYSLKVAWDFKNQPKFLSSRLQKAYLCLGFGYLVIAIGESFYSYNDYFVENSTSTLIGDLCFALFYPFVLCHLIFNIKVFAAQKIKSKKSVLTMIAIGASLVLLYLIINQEFISIEFSNEVVFEWYYVIISAFTLTLTLRVLWVLKGGVVGRAWLLLLVAFVFNNVGDIWYYSALAQDSYSFSHPTNLLWYIGYGFAVYALQKHKVII